MSEIKTLNGYTLVDITAREGVQKNADDITAINDQLQLRYPTLSKIQRIASQSFAGLFQNITGRAESFLFFTDPHLCDSENVRERFENWLNQIAAVYNSTPTSMCICGGDWLSNGNTRDNACWLLGLIDGAMKSRFDQYIHVVGNHDTNYQGYEYMNSEYNKAECQKCQLSTSALSALWYRKQGRSYFAADGDCTRFYVFDTGLDWYSELTDYRWEQIHWFAQSLMMDQPERCAILMHIVEYRNIPTPFAETILQVASAYNMKRTITLDGVQHDYRDSHGTVGFVLAGHRHGDYDFIQHGIPIVITRNLWGSDGQPVFDLVLVDWDKKIMHLIRAGEGQNRVIKLAD